MEVVKAFTSNDMHTDIVIRGTVDEPLFRASDIGEILEMGCIRSTLRDYDETEKVVHTMHTPGGDQSVTFLTEKGLYKVLFRSRKPIAERFQNWVCEVIKEIRVRGIYDLQQQIENSQKLMDKRLLEEKIKEKQEILLRNFGANSSVVYIIKVKSYENGEYIIKIGESGCLNARLIEHKKNYEECILLDCYVVNKRKQFESFLHHHDTIRKHKVRDLPKHENENELFRIGKELTYNMILRIINENIKSFNDWSVNDIAEIIKEENQKFLQNISNIDQINTIGQLMTKIEELEKSNQQILETQKEILKQLEESKLKSNIKISTNFNTPLPTLGHRLQKINPENGNLVKVYESAAECIKESKYELKRPTIEKAIQNNTIYHGFRWMYVARDKDPNIIENYEPTKECKVQHAGYIAKLDPDKTKIYSVYMDRKTAALENGYQSSSALDLPVKNGKVTRGFIYMLYEKCDDHLREEFENNYGEPFLYTDGIGQFDQDNQLIRPFKCKYDCIKQMQMSDKTLTKALNNNVMYQQHYYRPIGDCIKCGE